MSDVDSEFCAYFQSLLTRANAQQFELFDESVGISRFEITISRSWCDGIFRDKYDPYKNGATIFVHFPIHIADAGLLRFGRDAHSPGVIYESAGFLALYLAASQTGVAAGEIANAANIPAPIFRSSRTKMGEFWSSAPSLTYREMRTWSDRIDLFLIEGRFAAIFYKVNGNNNDVFRDTHDWLN